MPAWTLIAKQLVAAFKAVKVPPPAYPQGWALKADLPTYNALKNLHPILCTRLDPAGNTWAANTPPLSPAHPHPVPPFLPAPPYLPAHQFPNHLGVFPYATPAIANLAGQLLNILAAAGNVFPPNDPDLQDVLSFIRDAADCD